MSDDTDKDATLQLRPGSELPEHKRVLAELLLRQARWQDAIDQAEAGDAALLETLLRSDWSIPDFARGWLADRATRLAKRRRGTPAKIGDRLLAVERRHFRAWPGREADFIAYFADAYGMKYENAKRMLEAGAADERA